MSCITIALAATTTLLPPCNARASDPPPPIEWINPQSSFWEFASNWSTGAVPGAADTAVIALPGTYEVAPLANIAVANLDLLNPDATLSLFPGRSLSIGDPAQPDPTLRNDGLIRVNREGRSGVTRLDLGTPDHPASIEPGPNASGIIRLNPAIDGTNLALNTTLALPWGGTHHAGHTIAGHGTIEGVFQNQGLILADVNGPRLELFADLDQSPSGTLRATNNAEIRVIGATIFGGRIEADPGATILIQGENAVLAGGVQISGTLPIIAEQARIAIGGIVNNGVIRLADESTSHLFIDPDSPIRGTGVLELLPADQGSNIAGIFVEPGGTLIQGPGHTITGSGVVSGGIINSGTIRARAGGDLRIRHTVDQQSGGLIVAESGSELEVGREREPVIGGIIRSEPGATIAINGELSGGVRLQGEFPPNARLTVGIDQTATLETDLHTPTIRFSENAVLEGNVTLFEPVLTAITGQFAPPTPRIEPTIQIVNPTRISRNMRLPGGFTLDGPGRRCDIGGSRLDFEGTGTMALSNGATVTFEVRELVRNAVLRADEASLFSVIGLLELIDCTLEGTLRTGGTNGQIEINGTTLINNGRLEINTPPNSFSTIRIRETSTVNGTGQIDLIPRAGDDPQPTHIDVFPVAVLTLGEGQTLTGTGRLRGKFEVQGVIAPGQSPGDIATIEAQDRFTGDNGVLTLTDSATLGIDLAPAEPAPTLNDRIDATVDVNLAGVLRLGPATAGPPTPGVLYTVLTARQIAGRFSSIEYTGTLPQSLLPRVFYTDTHVTVAITCPADFALPVGVLDMADIDTFMTRFLQDNPAADIAQPTGILDLADIVAFIQGFLAGCG